MSDQPTHQQNRRASMRRPPRGRVSIECRRGIMGLGPNIGLTVIDVSQIGACIVSKVELPAGEEVELALTAPGQNKPLRLHATVARSLAKTDQGWPTGLRFRRHLTYAELQSLT